MALDSSSLGPLCAMKRRGVLTRDRLREACTTSLMSLLPTSIHPKRMYVPVRRLLPLGADRVCTPVGRNSTRNPRMLGRGGQATASNICTIELRASDSTIAHQRLAT
jgi:hypothetical protein